MSRPLAKLAVLLLYCLPAVAVLAFQLHGYRVRALDVVDELQAYARQVASAADADPAPIADNELAAQLVELYRKQQAMGVLRADDRGHFEARALSIWAYNSALIAALTLLPFFLLGGRLAFGDFPELGPRQKARFAARGWAMKLLVAFVVSLGWVYVLNPVGRGASVAYNYIATSDTVSLTTLPIYIDAQDLLTHTMCGFLGWYLHLLGYFFRKYYLGDVVSARVYGLFFRKFLFVYGIGLIITSVAADQAKVVTFLLGFFPLSAFSVLKEAGLKAFEGAGKKETSLLDLPLISRWEALRLEEEGIETVPALATADRRHLGEVLPIKPEVIDLWMDAARLEAVLGSERYERVKEVCRTASELVRRVKDPEFAAKLRADCGVANPEEIVTMLETTFGAFPKPA